MSESSAREEWFQIGIYRSFQLVGQRMFRDSRSTPGNCQVKLSKNLSHHAKDHMLSNSTFSGTEKEREGNSKRKSTSFYLHLLRALELLIEFKIRANSGIMQLTKDHFGF